MNDIYIIGIITALTAAFYFNIKKKEIPAFKVLAIFIVLLALPLAINLTKGLLKFESKPLFSFTQAIPFTYGALLYIYATFIIDSRTKFDKKDFYHLIPFISIFLILNFFVEFAPLGYHFNPHTETIMKLEFIDSKWIIFFSLLNISYIAYAASIIYKLKQHKIKIDDYFSNNSFKTSLSWLKICTLLFLGIKIILNTVYVTSNYIDLFDLSPDLINTYGIALFIPIFSIFSSGQPLIFEKEEKKSKDDNILQEEKEKKYEHSTLSTEKIDEYLKKMEQFVDEEKPYLENELNIVEFSEALGIKRHYITQILNDKLNMNFKTYINSFRIRYVTELLKDTKSKDLSLLEIAMEAGFNSKATFNRVFKENIGKTPTEFKKSLSA